MATMTRGDRVTSRRLDAVVGRASQLAELTAVLDEVAGGRSRFVVIGGEAGAGKTTLVELFTCGLSGAGPSTSGASSSGLSGPGPPTAQEVRHAHVVQGQCVALGGEGLPYAPDRGGFARAAGARTAETRSWSGQDRAGRRWAFCCRACVPGAEPGDLVRLQLFEAVARLLEHASSRTPLVLVIEDIHWADESTRHLLRFLARALTDASVLLIATYRTDELTRRHPLRPFLAEIVRLPGTSRIEVTGLDRDEVGQLLTGLLGHEPSPAVVNLVHRRSEGVPYFVEELAQSAARGLRGDARHACGTP